MTFESQTSYGYGDLFDSSFDEVAPGRRMQTLVPIVSSNGPISGERALLRAVLQDAILCLSGEGVEKKQRARIIAETRAWVTSRSRAWLFAFESICEILGLDADYLRRKLLAQAEPAATDAARNPSRDISTRVKWLRMRGNQNRKEIHTTGRSRDRRRTQEPSRALG